MGNIEDLLYKAYDMGKREGMLREVSKIRDANPHMSLSTVYERAYDKINN